MIQIKFSTFMATKKICIFLAENVISDVIVEFKLLTAKYIPLVVDLI